ncbi:hypothetical protein CERSUDRAFT_159757 [Gelatoporia subvermispora B]|uniref:Uncharacterized protein n=1 Tax=Ceriporiopsis subvermispora (strain B) TaxID=914234 RepID=M2R600_CERS8|nr:hypothetical protein CERSUDRAFT_159757 [Gelatoporia subvermispora B]
MSTPNGEVHPVATGPAAETVAKHQDPQDLVFYCAWYCPWSTRTWVALEEKGIPYQYREANTFHEDEGLNRIDPKASVPAIQYKGRALRDSLVICEFFEDAYPGTTPLLPADPFERAYARLWMDYVTKSVIPAFQRLTLSQEPDKQHAMLDELIKAMRTFTEKIKGPWFLGEQFSLVDIFIVPWVLRDHVIAQYRGYSRAAVGPGWEEYTERLVNRESVVKTQSLEEYNAEINHRYLRNEPQSVVTRAARTDRSSA